MNVDLAGKTVLVVGMKASGRAAAALAAKQGATVVGVDLKTDVEPLPGVRLELGPHKRDTFREADLVVVSPGVPASQPDLAAAAREGVPVLGELAFSFSHLADVPTIAITGTNGKSTVTWFTGQILEAAGYRPFIGGNLGNPLANGVIEVLDGAPKPGALVVEVSSYQMEWPGVFRPQVGVIINLTPDHLARHGDMGNYGRHKLRLFERMNEDGVAVLPAGDARLERLAKERPSAARRAWLGAHPGVVRDGRRAVVDLGMPIEFDLGPVAIPGEHNLDNAATAALLATAFGVPRDAIQGALGGLKALPHRMEIVAERDGVLWINDSKATNVEAAIVGIRGIDRPAVVLLGGEAKGKGFDVLVPLLERHRAVITFGGSGEAIADELSAAGFMPIRAAWLADAVDCARMIAKSGDAVLLSPGCASFDEFQNFEHRGRVFRDLASQEGP